MDVIRVASSFREMDDEEDSDVLDFDDVRVAVFFSVSVMERRQKEMNEWLDCQSAAGDNNIPDRRDEFEVRVDEDAGSSENDDGTSGREVPSS